MYYNNKISARQLKRMLILETIGISILLSTEISVYFAGRDGILSILLAGLMAYVYGWFILWICDRVKWNYWGYIKQKKGYVWKNIVHILFMVKYFFIGIMSLVVLCDVVKVQIMNELNYVAIFVSGLAVCLYGVTKGIEARGRLMEFLYVIMLIPIWILIVISLKGTDIYYLTPLLADGVGNVLMGAFVLFFLFVPIEMILFLSDNINASDHDKVKKVKREVYKGITYVLVINLIMFVLNVGHLGVNTISSENTSTVGLMKNIRFSNYVLEKQSGIFLIFLITAILLTILGILSQTVNLVWKMSDNKSLVAVVGIIVVVGFGTVWVASNVDRYQAVTASGTKRVELENREYIDSILIDYDEEGYKVILSFINIENQKDYREYNMQHISDLEKEYKKSSDKSSDYSSLQAILLSEKVIKNEGMFSNVFDMLERQGNIPENVGIYVAKSSNVAKISNVAKSNNATSSSIEEFGESESELTIGSYLDGLTKNNLEYAVTTFREIKNVINGTEEACLLSNFSMDNGIIVPNGITIIGQYGYVCEYSEEESGYIRMICGDSGIYITIDEKSYRVDKNKYYVNVQKNGEEGVYAKVTYSGKLTAISDNELTHKEINILLEKIIQNRITFLMEKYNLDIINICKYMSVSDRQQWLMYNLSKQKLYRNMYIEVETEF